MGISYGFILGNYVYFERVWRTMDFTVKPPIKTQTFLSVDFVDGTATVVPLKVAEAGKQKAPVWGNRKLRWPIDSQMKPETAFKLVTGDAVKGLLNQLANEFNKKKFVTPPDPKAMWEYWENGPDTEWDIQYNHEDEEIIVTYEVWPTPPGRQLRWSRPDQSWQKPGGGKQSGQVLVEHIGTLLHPKHH
jgi:hypothetical protein